MTFETDADVPSRRISIKMTRPRVKPEHAAYRISAGRIRLGGVSYGIASEVVDPAGSVWTLLDSMDGSRTVDEVVARVLELHPGESADSVRAGVELFVESGYVEDAGAVDPGELTSRDKTRHDRGRGYLRWMDLTPRASTWEPQVALRRARVTVVGVGGTGGVAAMALAASGVGELHLMDFDTVELSNLNRQVLFTEEDLGRSKVTAAVDRLRRLNSDISITGETRRIAASDDMLPPARGCDVLLLAADRPMEIRAWANRACLAAGTPWVDAGYHGPLVTFAVYWPGVGACYECVRAGQADEHHALGVNLDDTPHRGQAVANAVAAPSAGVSGYLAAHGVISAITKVPPIAPGRVYGVNMVAVDSPFVVEHPRRPDCPGCGGT